MEIVDGYDDVTEYKNSIKAASPSHDDLANIGVKDNLTVLTNRAFENMDRDLLNLGFKRIEAPSSVDESYIPRPDEPESYRQQDGVRKEYFAKEDNTVEIEFKDEVSRTTGIFTDSFPEHSKKQTGNFQNQLTFHPGIAARKGSEWNMHFTTPLLNLIQHLEETKGRFCLPNAEYDGKFSPVYHPSDMAP